MKETTRRSSFLVSAMRCIASLLLAVSLTSLSLAQVGSFTPTSTPINADGTRAVGDLPVKQHMRNTGGRDGSGLCVFTSIEMVARWQNLLSLAGYRAWMEKRDGGGWPEKVDQTIAQYCRERGVAIPRYVQHTAGDLSFLDLAIRTGRTPAITYAGQDNYYGEAINHMVFLAHLDETHAAIIDNNRPGSWLWMTRAELKARWLASADRWGRWVSSGGGWAVVFLDPPPTPYPAPPTERLETVSSGPPGCDCGPDCPCPDCKCASPVFGQCANGRCVAPPASGSASGGSTSPGAAPSDRHYWGQFEDGVWGWRLKPEADAAVNAPTGGVVPEKIGSHPAYTINGRTSTKEEVYSLFQAGSLADDTGRWHLAIVGDATFLGRVKSDVAKLAADVREKLHVQAYTPTAWQVEQFKLPAAGVALRKPAAGRVSSDVGTIAAAEYSSTRLDDLLGDPAGPAPKPVPPKSGPNNPSAPASPASPWVLGAAAAAVIFFLRRK